MKKHNIWITVLVSMMFLPSLTQAAIRSGIAAVVNEEVITIYELNQAFAQIQLRIDTTYKGENKEQVVAKTKTALLNRMIDEMLIEQEAKKTGIVIKDEDVNEAINNVLVTRNISKNDLIKMLEKDGVTFEAYSKETKTQLARVRLIRREINAKVGVSEEEIGEYYSKHRDLFEGKEAVRIKQILLPFPPNMDEQGKSLLKAEAEKIIGQLKRGASFEGLVSKYAQGSAGASGGDLGFIERGVILPAVENVAFSLPLEEISDIIESAIGFHVIKVTDKRGAGAKSFESVRDEIREKIMAEKAEKRYEGWIEELRKKSHVEIRI